MIDLEAVGLTEEDATFTKGTVEFRCFQFDKPANGKQNGLQAGQLKAMIQLCLAIPADCHSRLKK